MDSMFRDQLPSQIPTIENLNERAAAISSMVTKTIGDEDYKDMIVWAVQEAHGLTFSRMVVNEFIDQVNKLTEEIKYDLLLFTLDICSQRTTAFEEQISIIREQLAEIAQNRGDYTLAANFLIGIPLDSGHRNISNNTKLSYYVRISRLLLEDEDFVGAESYINRAGFLLDNSVEKVLQLQFKAAQARILDMKRQFLPAATKYYELSLDKEMHESERNTALKSAITCCILAGAGPHRSRMLNTLYKDERIQNKNIDASYHEFREKGLFLILEKMYYGGILKKDQVAEFQESLLSHQLAKLADGSTVFDRAIMEHNLLSVSKLFTNITFQLLAYLLSVSPSQAEQIAASMIEEGRMCGTLDQVESLIHFSQENPMEEWKNSITQTFSHLDQIVSKVAKKHPEWMGSL